MKVPDKVLNPIRERLWAQADEDGWMTLTDVDKTRFYEQWVRHEEVGGVLSRYMDGSEIRVYLKDTVMKPYPRERAKDPTPVLKRLQIPDDEFVVKEFVKPHGRVFHDGRVISWGRAKNWKAILLATYERAYGNPARRAYAAVLMHSAGNTEQEAERAMIADLGQRLGIERVEWLEA